jgi:hypothetical protein
MSKTEIPELRVEDFYAGLEMIDEGTKQHILEHVHNAAIIRARKAAEAAMRPDLASTPQLQMDKDWS